jgi:hypothetical protein
MADKNFEFPTEIIDLPSKGLVYPEGHPLRKGSVEIKYMTAREEDILASQTLIRKGIVLDKLFESVVVESGVNVNDIFIGDKNAILLATRVLGYGAQYDVEVTDPFTLEKQEVNIDLSKVKVKEIDESLLNGENSYEFTLPSTGKKIIFKLLNHGDEKLINADIQAMDRINKGNAGTNDVTTRFRYMIKEVDGNQDPAYITKWINNGFLARDAREFRKYVKNISPDLDLTFDFVSNITGETEALDIPFGISFFYPAT